MKKNLWIPLLVIMNLSLMLLVVTRTQWIPEVSAQSETSDPFDAVQDRFNRVVAEVLPSVVEISVENIQTEENGSPIPWEDFFDLPEGEEPSPEDFRSFGLGSGIIVRHIDNTYYILTNYHVTGRAPDLRVSLDDGREYEAQLVGTDDRKDLALVSIETEETLAVATLGDSDQLRVGDFVLAMGSPLGYKSSVSSGIVSALGRTDSPDGNINNFIQTDAAINQGNSGGALVDLKGRVIGVNTWISSSTGGNMGLAFSIPINNAKKNIDDFIQYGEIQYGWLGVSIGDMNDYLREEYPEIEGTGSFVFQVFTGSPAWDGGIRPGDYIESINGKMATSRKELTFLIGELYPGDKAEFEVLRNGRRLTLTAEIRRRAEESKLGSLSPQAWPGITILPLNERVLDALEWENELKGVLVDQVFPQTRLQLNGLRSGDVIQRIGREEVNNMKDFYRLIDPEIPLLDLLVYRQETEETFQLLIERDSE